MSQDENPGPAAKPARTQARRPRGLPDRMPADLAATQEMMRIIQRVYALYGFEPVETPFLEYTDALGKFLPDQDRPNAGVFSLRDDDGQWMSLRYDLTAPLARYVAENWQNLPKPYRSYRSGYVFRNEKPGPGRFRQFMQFDADTVGSASVAADAEICMMAADTLDSLGLFELDANGNKRPLYVIKVNNRKILDGVMEAIGLGGEENAGRRLIVLRALDKFDKFGLEGVYALLGSGRMDESGDFTKGANLNKFQTEMIISKFLRVIKKTSNYSENTCRITDDMEFDSSGTLFVDNKIIASELAGSINNELYREGAAELAEMAELFEAAGYGSGRIQIDPSIVRGLEYYTGPVFEAELLFKVTDEEGKPVRFGSVGGGGRYDGLVSRFLDEPVPATGFSIGVSRLLAALQALGKVPVAAPEGPVIMLAMDRTPAAMARYQRIVASLREAGIPAEIYLGEAGMKAQLKYADRRKARIALIQGSNEVEKGEVMLKDLVLGATLSNIQDRAEYRARQEEAQFSVPVAEVVAKVREVLARHR